ncbi:hypothetical protein BACCIP111899_03591 [Bacillus rhizoplanae]|uniref:Uncharacterized protein n=1 Tax=Bacillus rhizoplanae TaxID=2880966 RepID=A0ABN8A246_9BACI|nr:hypothetical protein [Bacillus rhizoplanae]CAG9614364.1 hypothetical protein BACCIP111899_03591 [Bacillus rhizoplanae]
MKIVYNRAILQLLSVKDARLLYSIIEKHPDIWTYLITNYMYNLKQILTMKTHSGLLKD